MHIAILVQDFAPEVQEAVNRIQSVDETRLVIDAARATGFKSVSMDLIYGLPKQNVISFNRTLEQVLQENFAGLPSTTYEPKQRRNSFFEAILSEVVLQARNALMDAQYEVTL